MLTFISTPAMAMSLGLRTFGEDVQEARPKRHPRAGRATRRTVGDGAKPAASRGRRSWWPARARLAH